jgi:ABC-type uncharacterized transport system substrate-binding protein
MTTRFLQFVLVAVVLGSPWSIGGAEADSKVAVLGFVAPLSPSTFSRVEAAFWQRLRGLGWVEGQNVVIAKWSAEGHLDRLPALMAEAVNRKVDVLVTYGTPAAAAAKNATTTIPLVIAVMPDPVRSGLVASLARPGANLTGLSEAHDASLSGKMVELLRESFPRLSTLAVIVNPNNPMTREHAKDLKALAAVKGLKLSTIELSSPRMLDSAFQQARRTAPAVVVLGEPITLEYRERVVSLAAKYGLASIYLSRDYVDAGGLMSYGPDLAALFRRAADYVDKILRGAKPGDLPVEQPTQYALVVNLNTAKALGLTIPESILVRADEVIR